MCCWAGESLFKQKEKAMKWKWRQSIIMMNDNSFIDDFSLFQDVLLWFKIWYRARHFMALPDNINYLWWMAVGDIIPFFFSLLMDSQLVYVPLCWSFTQTIHWWLVKDKVGHKVNLMQCSNMRCQKLCSDHFERKTRKWVSNLGFVAKFSIIKSFKVLFKPL